MPVEDPVLHTSQLHGLTQRLSAYHTLLSLLITVEHDTPRSNLCRSASIGSVDSLPRTRQTIWNNLWDCGAPSNPGTPTEESSASVPMLAQQLLLFGNNVPPFWHVSVLADHNPG